jgi:hypothetical protein
MAVFEDSMLLCFHTELFVVSGLAYTVALREERIKCSNPYEGVEVFRVHYGDEKTGVHCNRDCDICEYSVEQQLWDKRRSNRT